MEQLLVIVFLGLLVGFGTARKRKSTGRTTAKPHPHPHIPVEDIFPSAQALVEEPEDPRYSATISDSVQSLEEPDYVFAEVEASQEETEKMKPEFSLRDAVVNQTILERKYH